MAYERYGRGDDDYRRDQGSDRQGGRDYYGAGEVGGYDRDRAGGYGRSDYGQGGGGQRDYGRRDYGQGGGASRDYGTSDYGQRSYGGSDYGQRDYGAQSYGQDRGGRASRTYDSQDRDRGFTGGDSYYRGGQEREQGRGDRSRSDYDRAGGPSADRGGDRGFLERAGDEVRSWFGDEQAERRREQDSRHDERTGSGGAYGRDEHYHDWRDQQIASFDRDYHEYRQENRQKFHAEFATWRNERQGQRDLLGKVTEHLDVVGSDGEHVGTVDKVRGDRVILTKSDPDAGGHHHSFPSRWLQSVEGGKATLTKTAAEAKQQWQDEERQGAVLGGRQGDSQGQASAQTGATDLNRSFSGTY